MGVGISIIIGTVVDVLYDLTLAGIWAATLVVGTIDAIAAGIGSLALTIGSAALSVVPYAFYALPFIATYAPYLALGYFLYNYPVITAAFVFGAIALGGATVAATSLINTEGNGGPTDPNNGLVGNELQVPIKSPEEAQRDFDLMLEYITDKEQLRKEIDDYSKEVSLKEIKSTIDTVSGPFAPVISTGLDAFWYLFGKKSQIAQGAKAFVESGSQGASWINSFIQSRVARFRTRSKNPPPIYDYSFEDLDQSRSARIKLKSGETETATCGVTIDDFIYGLATCEKKKGCPSLTTKRKRNVSVRNVSGRNKSKRKVRVPNRKRVNRSVRFDVNKNRTSRTNRKQSVRKVRKVTKRRRVGKQK